MNAAPMPAVSAIFGSREHLDVSRALGELQARRPVRVRASGEDLIALPVEGTRRSETARIFDVVQF